MKSLNLNNYLLPDESELNSNWLKLFDDKQHEEKLIEIYAYHKRLVDEDMQTIIENTVNLLDDSKIKLYLNLVTSITNELYWKFLRNQAHLISKTKDLESLCQIEINIESEPSDLKSNFERQKAHTLFILQISSDLVSKILNFESNIFEIYGFDKVQSSNEINPIIEDKIHESEENTVIKLDKLKLPFEIVKPIFSALIEAESLKDENNKVVNKTNAAKYLTKYIAFIQKNGDPYKESTINKNISSSFEQNEKSTEFLKLYNQCVLALGKPSLVKSVNSR